MTQNLIKINGIYDCLTDDCTRYNILATFNIFYKYLDDTCDIKYELKNIYDDKLECFHGSLKFEVLYDFLYILNNFSESDEVAQKIYKDILFYKILNIICDKEGLDWGNLTFELIHKVL